MMTSTILVVDDDRAVLESYGRLLRRLGHTVFLAEDADLILADPESLRGIDLIILDQRMPRTSGLGLLAGLRGRSSGRRTEAGEGNPLPAVILISALLSDDLRKRADSLGVVEILEKPVDTKRLLASVTAALNGAAGPRPSEPSTPHP